MAKKASTPVFQSIASEEYWNNIRNGLLYWVNAITVDGQVNIQNLNIHAEGFFQAFLNTLFSWDLDSANVTIQRNAPGIDLFFQKERIGVQVSSTCTAEKIRHSIKLASKLGEMHFYFLAIKAQYRPSAEFEVPAEMTFDPDKDVLDIGTLMKQVLDCDIDKQKELSDLVDKYIKKTSTEPAKPAPRQKPCAQRPEEFLKDWNKNAFLDDGVPLSEIYLEPHCRMNGKGKRLSLAEAEQKLKKKDQTELLILGQPGVGKSTLVSYFSANYKGERPIFAFRCRRLGLDWTNCADIYEAILEKTKLTDHKALEDSILILDGLDEIAGGQDLKRIFKNITQSHLNSSYGKQAAHLVITCRENYIEGLETTGSYNYITLCPFDEEQIPEFCQSYGEAAGKDIPGEAVAALCKNEEVYGIPLICYMVLALDIPVEADSSIVDVYDRIFRPESDHCIYKKTYDRGGAASEEMRQKLHRLSQDMALWIFNNNYKAETIPLEELEKLAKKNRVSLTKGLGYFKDIRHSESSSTAVSFIHRSMMEYFTADAAARGICPYQGTPIEQPTQAVREVSWMLWWQYLTSGECRKYLEKMLKAGTEKLDDGKRQEVYQQWELAVFRQLEAGVPAWSGAEIEAMDHYHRQRAATVSCQNLLRVLELIRECCKVKGKIGAFAHENMKDDGYRRALPIYIQVSPYFHWSLQDYDLCCANLHGGNLCYVDLSGADLHNADLRRANLRGANLRSAELWNADLRYAVLIDADLRNADLCSADLRSAALCGADLRGADLRGANLRKADLGDVWLSRATTTGAIQELKAAKFDTIKVWDDQKAEYTSYTREEFFSEFDKPKADPE